MQVLVGAVGKNATIEAADLISGVTNIKKRTTQQSEFQQRNQQNELSNLNDHNIKNKDIYFLTKKSQDQVSEMLQRKRTQRGEQMIINKGNSLPKQTTPDLMFSQNKAKDDRDLRIGEYIDTRVTKEVLSLTRMNTKQSKLQSRKNSKKTLQIIPNENVKGKIQKSLDHQEYISCVVNSQQQVQIAAGLITTQQQRSKGNNPQSYLQQSQASPSSNNHYFQGHYQKMFTKQARQLELQKIQSALIVRNIKTLSKIADSKNEISHLKKTENSSIMQDDTMIRSTGANYNTHHKASSNMHKQQQARVNTLIPNSSQNELRGHQSLTTQGNSQLQNYSVEAQHNSPYTRNKQGVSDNNFQTYIKEVCDQYNPKHRDKINANNIFSKSLVVGEDLTVNNTGGVQSPFQPHHNMMNSARNGHSGQDYQDQEMVLKCFNELESTEGWSNQLSQMPSSKKKAKLKNMQNNLKIDSYNKLNALSYGGPQNYNDHTQSLFPLIHLGQGEALGGSQGELNIYPSMLSQIAKQNLIQSMHSPTKIKTRQDLIKKSVIDLQLIDGTWIIEPNQVSKGMNDIVVKGKQVPNKFVQIGGIKPIEMRRKSNLQSARGNHHQKANSNTYQANETPSKKTRKNSLLSKGTRDKYENRSIDFKNQSKLYDQNLAEVDQENDQYTNLNQNTVKQQRPSSKYNHKPKLTMDKNQPQSQIQLKNRMTLQHKQQLDVNKNRRIFNAAAGVGTSSDVTKQLPNTNQSTKADTNASATPGGSTTQPGVDEDFTKSVNEDNNVNNGQQQLNNQQGVVPKNNYSFRPRRPIVNPVEQARLEQERLIQMKNEAKEKYQQFSLQNKQNNAKYKYIICAGNNSQVVKRCMELRKDRWEETNDFDTLFNFKWHPISKGIRFEMLNTHGTRQLVNHFENHECFTTKDQMFKNLLQHCESRKLNVFEYVPVTFLLEVDSINYAFELEKFITYFSYVEKLIQSKPIELYKKDPELMESLLNNINNKYQNHQMTKDEKGPTFAKRKIPTSHFKAHNIWILKATGFNRGRGIHVFNKLEDLKKLVKEYTDGVNFDHSQFNSQTNKLLSKQLAQQSQQAQTQQQPTSFSNIENVPSYLKSTSFVIQKYVEQPLLLRNRKFDIRVWIVVTQDARCFFFKEGYIRTSCEEYSLSQESITKASVHLTNNAVQKYAENYGKFEDGNQLSFNDLQNIINEESNDSSRSNYVKQELVPKMKDIIILSLESVKKRLKIGKGCCFELFGYDFIIDRDFQPWLIEVNTNPCLEESSQLLLKYIPRMINDMLKLTLDNAFPSRKGQQQNYDQSQLNVFPVDEYPIDENMWEYLCQLDYTLNLNIEKQNIGTNNTALNSQKK